MRSVMKKSVFIGVALLVGCAQLQNGQIQPVVLKNAKESTYYTSCAGAVEDWSSCYDKAARTCNKGYMVLSKEDNNRGTQRDFTFQCKK